jgi:hypothetical protein
MGTGELIMLFLMSFIFRLATFVLGICIQLVIYGRMMEIYLTMSVAPIPLATISNGEIGHMGKQYFKTVFALALQGFFMMISVIIYQILVLNVGTGLLTSSGNVLTGMGAYLGITVMLVVTLFKSGGMAKAIIS